MDRSDYWERHFAAQARLQGRSTYKSQYECSVQGHGRMRYVKGFGCVRCADARRARKEARGDQPRAGKSSTVAYRLWQAARTRAEAKNLAFTIRVEDIVIPDTCPVFGTPLTSPSLDRFDNSRGYTPDNIRVISRRANTIKSDATLAEILAVAEYMADEYAYLLG